MTTVPPKILGNYKVISELGEGAMAKVYLASHTRIPELTVAIKVVDNKHPESETLLGRFEREARLLASVKHHHLVRIYDFGKTISGSFYIAMDFIKGYDLRTLIDSYITSGTRFDPLLIIKIAKEICEALEVIHDAGIVHRDLKPENIMLEETRRDPHFVRVLDFGIAKMLDTEDNPKRFQTAVGMICGTPQYLSPEQAKGETLDGRSDLYALGCILYEMLSLQLPFTADNPVAYLTKHITEPPFPLDFRAPDSNQKLRLLAHLLLSKDPDDRPYDAFEVYDALLDIEDGIAKQRSPRRNSRIMRMFTPPPTPNTTSLAGLVSEVSMPVGVAVDDDHESAATNTEEIFFPVSLWRSFFTNHYAKLSAALAVIILATAALFSSNKEQLIDFGNYFSPIAESQAKVVLRPVTPYSFEEQGLTRPRRAPALAPSVTAPSYIGATMRGEQDTEDALPRRTIATTFIAPVVAVSKPTRSPAQKLATAKVATKNAATRTHGCAQLKGLFSTTVGSEARSFYNVYCSQ